jgi:hypothetical protein
VRAARKIEVANRRKIVHRNGEVYNREKEREEKVIMEEDYGELLKKN